MGPSHHITLPAPSSKGPLVTGSQVVPSSVSQPRGRLTLRFQVPLGLRPAGEEVRGLPREPPPAVDTALTHTRLLVPTPTVTLPVLDPSALCPSLMSANPEGQQVSEGQHCVRALPSGHVGPRAAG